MKHLLFAHAGSQASVVIISIALMMFAGHLMTRITRLMKLPNVTGYILAGIVIGPYCMDLIPQEIIGGMDFLSDIALAFIAFSTGKFFRFSVLKKNGWKVVIITVLESIFASVCVFAAVYGVLRLDLAFSIVLAALASATAPASTIMTIRQTKAKGDFVDTLLQVVALDDVVGLILYSMAISAALASQSKAHGIEIMSMLRPIAINGVVLLLGGGFGWLMKTMMPRRKQKDNRLIISVTALFAFCGICTLVDVSPLLGCMSMGMIYVNLSDDDKLFKQLIPQAGVSIGLAALGARTLGGEMGIALQTIILASSVLYELTGPACAKLSLYLSGSYGKRLAKTEHKEPPIPHRSADEKPSNGLEHLLGHLRLIYEEIPKPNG